MSRGNFYYLLVTITERRKIKLMSFNFSMLLVKQIKGNKIRNDSIYLYMQYNWEINKTFKTKD